MTVHLVTGHAGKVHVTSAEQGALNARLWGSGRYVLSGCKVTVTDNNTVHVSEGTLLVDGRHVNINDGGDDVTISTGTVGKRRRDVICLKYSMDVLSGVESCALEVVEGQPGDAFAAPAVQAGSILDGDNPVMVPIATVDIGPELVLSNPIALLGGLTTLADGGVAASRIDDICKAAGLRLAGR